MKTAKTPKNLKEMPYLLKKNHLKRKGNSIAPVKTNAPISSEGLQITIQTYQMRSKELDMKLGQLKEKISKASFPVSADLSNDLKYILETDQRNIYPP